MSDNKMNILKRMSMATEKINRVAKNLQVGIGKNSYKAVGEADVLAAVKPIEAECGIYSYPVKRTVLESGRYTVVSEYNGTKAERENFMVRIEVVYRFCNIDDPNDYIEITSYGDGWDAQDKAPGKAMTYADKYALLKAYKIETGDDPDQNMSGEVKAQQELKNPAPQRTPQETIMKYVNARWSDPNDAIEPLKQILSKYGYKRVNEVMQKHVPFIVDDIRTYGTEIAGNVTKQ